MKRSSAVYFLLVACCMAAMLVAGMAFTSTAGAQVLKGSTVYSPQWGGFQMERLNQELRLSEAQQAKIRPALEEEQREMAEIRHKTAGRIRRELNNEQRTQFDRTYGR